MADPLSRYLSRLAEPEIALANSVLEKFDHVLVIPAMDETPEFVAGLRDACGTRAVLCIVVVNAPEDADPSVHDQNAAVLDALRSEEQLEILVVDRASERKRLPPRSGVGTARKIGADLALALHSRDKIRSRWIHMTDADVILPEDYFRASDAVPEDAVALTYPYWHLAERESYEHRALALYEISLHYYVRGLAWAGSPYAHHTVGSTMAVSADAYAVAQGVPKREAAEDFYLMNKLAKLGRVVVPESRPIEIHARASNRVPFGTGAANARIADDLRAGKTFLLYHPDCFHRLRETLAGIRTLRQPDHPLLGVALKEMGFPEALDTCIRETTSPDRARRRLHQWFDAFRTLKLIHRLRDLGLASIPWQDAVSRAPFAPPPNASLRKELLRGFRSRI